MKPNKIEFIESHNVIGEQMCMWVEGVDYDLECRKCTGHWHEWYKQHAIEILKEVYNLDYKAEDIKFVWDRTL